MPREAAGRFADDRMSEAGAESDVVGMKLKAETVAGGFRLNGTKFWIAYGSEVDTLVVYARTGEGSKGITAFLIEKGLAGFSIGQKIDKMGMCAHPLPSWCSTTCNSASCRLASTR